MKTITEDGEIIDVVTHEVIAREPPFFKTPYNHDTDVEARSTALTCMDPSKTQQQFAKESDINVILAKFLKTGELSTTGPAKYGDQEDALLDLQDRIVTQYEVDQAWSSLSAEVRNTLKNPATFASYVEHCLEVGDLAPLEALGLAQKRDQPEEVSPAPPEVKTPPGA